MSNDIFQNERLIQARILKGYKQKDIAIACDISPSVISQYEKAKVEPSYETLQQIAKFLRIDIKFFYQNKPKFFIKNIAFRKAKTTAKDKVLQAENISHYLTEIKKELIDKYANLPKLNIPNFNWTISENAKNINYDLIENIASQTREYWKLGNAPISNVIKLLECNGIFVFKIQDNDFCKKIDAFSWLENKNAIIFLTTNKTAVRSRFDALHELGHLILHKDIDIDLLSSEERDILEKEADYFAGCFLLPKQSMLEEYVCNNLEALFDLKRRWKTSVQAIAYRLEKLNIINENQRKWVFIQLAQKGCTKNDIVDKEIQHESMFLFNEISKNLQDKINIKDIILIKDIYHNLGFNEDKVKENIIPFYKIKS